MQIRSDVEDRYTSEIRPRHQRPVDCFWCGDLLITGIQKLICAGCAAQFDPDTYLSDYNQGDEP